MWSLRAPLAAGTTVTSSDLVATYVALDHVTTLPSRSKSGPPESPDTMPASVWSIPCRVSDWTAPPWSLVEPPCDSAGSLAVARFGQALQVSGAGPQMLRW